MIYENIQGPQMKCLVVRQPTSRWGNPRAYHANFLTSILTFSASCFFHTSSQDYILIHTISQRAYLYSSWPICFPLVGLAAQLSSTLRGGMRRAILMMLSLTPRVLYRLVWLSMYVQNVRINKKEQY